MRDYSKIPLGIIQTDRVDSRMFTSEMFSNFIHYSQYPEEVSAKINLTAQDQGMTSMCLAFAEARMLEIQNYMETGIYEKLSEGYIYYRKDFPTAEGMVTLFELDNIRKKGTVLESDFRSFGKWSEINEAMKKYDKQALAVKANEYRAKTTLGLLPEHVPAYLIHHHAGIVTIDVFDSFYAVGKDGIFGEPVGTNRGGHGMAFIATEIINDKLGIWIWNSWGSEWGKEGMVWIALDNPCIKGLYGAVDVTPTTNQIVFLVGKKTMYTSKGNIDIPIAPFYVKDEAGQSHAMLPMRAMAEALGKEVTWEPRDGGQDRIAFDINPQVYAMLYLDNEG